MSYIKWTNKSWNVEVPKLSILRRWFNYRIGHQLRVSTLMVSLDETTLIKRMKTTSHGYEKGTQQNYLTTNLLGVVH